MWLVDLIFSIDNIWLKSYIVISFVFTCYFFVRLFLFSFKEMGKILWGVIVVPILLGLTWPISIVNRIVMKRWIANWMNNIHWWEE